MYKKKCGKKCKNVIQNNICKKKQPFIWKIHFHFLEKFNCTRYMLYYKIKYFF